MEFDLYNLLLIVLALILGRIAFSIFVKSVWFIGLILFTGFCLFLFSPSVQATPGYLTVQTKIAKPDGYVLEAAAVDFRMIITDPIGTCVLYREDFSAVDMRDSKGLIAFTLGSGTKHYAPGGLDIIGLFTNFNSPVFACQGSGTYTAAATDTRKLMMQFNDGSGWQTVPSMSINAVPYALESRTAHRLGLYPAADYTRRAEFETCDPGEAVFFNGASFTCVTTGGGSNVTLGGNTGAVTLGTNDSSALNLETNNTTRMTIDATGNVGIGTSVLPAATLHTATTGAKTTSTTSNYIENTATSSTASVNKIGLDIQSTGAWNGTSAVNTGLNVNVSGGTTNYAAIFQGGNVGIGTATPTAQVHVVGAAGTGASAAPMAMSVNGGAGGTNANGGGISLTTGSGTGAGTGGELNLISGSGDSGGSINILAGGSSNGGSSTNVLIRGGFHVGNGSTGAASLLLSPSGTLFGGSVTLASGVASQSGSVTIRTPNAAGGSNADGGTIYISAGRGSDNGTMPGRGGAIEIIAGDAGLNGNNNGSNVVLNPGAKAGVGVDGNVVIANLRGNVGVGTTTPQAKLEVSGDLKVGNSSATCNASTQGSIRYNNVSAVLEFCNGSSWNLVQAAACSDATPNVFAFNNESNQATSAVVTSNIIQITGINCTVPVTISGVGTPQFQICNDAACASVVQGWTSGPSSIVNGQYIQVRHTSDIAGGATTQSSIIIGGTASIWSVSTAGGDCVATTPPVGTVCADGTVYAGLSPDGSVKMFTTRCDYGQTWSMGTCQGSRLPQMWNNGNTTYTATGFLNQNMGKANSAGLFVLADSNAPYQAATTCENLVQDGHSDWYLPAKNEVLILFANRSVIRNFIADSATFYWSSTDTSGATWAITHRFTDGTEHYRGKNEANLVRCVRR